MNEQKIKSTLLMDADFSQVSSKLNQMQGILKQLKLSPTLKKEFDSLFTTAKTDLEKYQSKLQSGFKTKGDVTGLEKSTRSLEKTFATLGKEWEKLQSMDLASITRLDPDSANQIKQIEEAFKRITTELQQKLAPQVENINNKIASLTTTSSKNAGKEISNMLGAGQYEEAAKAIDKYIAKQEKALASFGKKKEVNGTMMYDLDDSKTASLQKTLDTYIQIKSAINEMGTAMAGYDQEVARLDTSKMEILSKAMAETEEKVKQGSSTFAELKSKVAEYGDATKQAAQKTLELNSDIDMLKSRVQYFFSLTNSVAIFRRILKQTIDTTKELDAAMTETAVVTDFSVADMWKDLPRYTNTAKELGATIQGVYETMTLYYQQGLKTNEVFEVGTETLKMARIAGLNYEKATDFMTAALRGFNMEINELNAQKVNDVYSELAAITAADTKEIATAMTKTASIASNANMEFETTAAFLSQIIETTRESAETAGTAMKTVIARFTELKKDPAEIGEVDGEIVDANKIETALRTIDVALRDTSGQFRDLDDVFLDIAAKWEGLDTNTQRYIATMAAGSRQQSRFIAMMSDYERTMQLVSAANDSAGASQKQFDKTLESLEAKLNQLKTAWDQFTMGIANNTVIKAGVDALTGFINIINKLTENLPGVTKGLGNLLILIGGFSAGGKVFRAFSASVLADMTALAKGSAAAGTKAGVSFGSALVAEFGKTGKTISKLFSKKTWINTGDLFSNSLKAMDKELGDIANRAADAFYSIEDGFDDTLEASAYNKALADRNLLMKASIKDQQAYTVLRQAGLPIETAQLALKKELNEEDWEELAIQSLLIGTDKTRDELTKDEIKNRLILLKTKQAEFNADKMGLATKAKYIALLFLGNPAQKREARERLVAAGSTWAQKIALDGLNLSLGTNIALLTIGIALIAGLAVALVMMTKAAKENTLEYKMEKAAEATERAKEAANNAKEAYDELISSIEEIGTKESELEKLTYGTVEWQQALLEVNQQVMDLIDKFPDLRSQLLNELKVDADGKLSLTTEGYNLVKEKRLEQYKNAVAGQTMSGSYEASLRRKKALQRYENFNPLIAKVQEGTQTKEKATLWDKISGFGQSMVSVGSANAAVTTGQTGLTQQYTSEMSKGLQQAVSDVELISLNETGKKDDIYEKFLEAPEMFLNPVGELENDLAFFASSLNVHADTILDMVPILKQRQAAELEYEASMQSQAKQMLVAATSETFQADKDKTQVAESFSKFYRDQGEKDTQTEIDELDLVISDAQFSDYASKAFGLDEFEGLGDTTKSLQKLYSELTGNTMEQVEEMFGENDAALKEAIANIKVGKDWGTKLEDFADTLDGITKQIKGTDYLSGLFGGTDGKGLTKEQAETILQAFNGTTAPNSSGNMTTTGYTASVTDEVFGELENEQYTGNEVIQQLYDVFKESEFLQQQYGKGLEGFNAFIEWAVKEAENTETVYNQATDKLSNFFGKDSSNLYPEGLDAGAIEGLSNQLIQMLSLAGEKAIKGSADQPGFADQLKAISKDMDSDELNAFIGAFNAIDLTNKEQILQFSESLKALGINLPENQINAFELKMIELGQAVSKIKLENLIESVRQLGGLASQIKTGEKNRGYSQEEVDLLTSTGALQSEDFVFNIETGDYTYIQDSAQRIVSAIQQQTAELLGGKTYETAAISGGVYEKFLEEGITDPNDENKKIDVSNIEDTDYDKKIALIQAYNDQMFKETESYVYSTEFLEKLKTNTNNQVFQDEIDKIYEQILNDYLNKALNMEKAAQAKTQGEVSQAQLYGPEYVQGVIEDNTKQIGILKAKSELSEEEEKTLQDLEAKTNNYRTALALLAFTTDENSAEASRYVEILTLLNGGTELSEEKIAALKKEAKELEKAMASTTGYRRANAALGELVEGTIDLLDAYEDLEGETAKINQVQAMVDNLELNFDVDEENYQDVYDYMLGLARGSHEAYLGLMNLSLGKFGVTVTGEGKFEGLTEEIWAVDSLFQQFMKNMVDNGAFVEETVTVTETQKYIGSLQKVVKEDGSVSYEPVPKEAKVGSTITILRPRDAESIASVSTTVGGGSDYTPSSSNDSSSSDDTPWENPYDSFYNITEDINELLDKRNSLEKEFEMLLHNENSTVDDFIESYKERLGSYVQEIALQKQVLKLRQQEQEDILSRNSNLSEYAWVENGAVYIDFEAIDRVEDQELGEEIEEYIDALEENDEAIQEANDAVQEATLAMEDLVKEWRDSTADFEQEVFDAIVAEREREIEQLEEASETLAESNSNLIDAIQEEINLRRQQRDNEEKEKEIADKERRLAFLSQDTSGAYVQEVLGLEKDITEQREDYTDTLIDQKISELQKQNDEAEKQREKQIRILQYQLENDQKTGVIAQEVRKMLQEATSDAGWNRVWGLLEKSKGFAGLTDTNKVVWIDQTREDFKKAVAYLNGWEGGGIAAAMAKMAIDAADGVASQYNEYIAGLKKEISDLGEQVANYSKGATTGGSGETLQDSAVDTEGVEWRKIGSKWYKDSDTTKLEDGTYSINEGAEGATYVIAVTSSPTKDLNLAEHTDKNKAIENGMKYGKVEKINGKEYFLYQDKYYPLSSLIAAATGRKTEKKAAIYMSKIRNGTKAYAKKYATGGLADYTGPAWLDGTKSKPELVLNQKDTQNFLQLKDILSSFMNQRGNSTLETSVGDTIYDITISVEKLSNDYDVEQVANKVKQIISNDALYRNSNMINRLR